MIKHVHHLLTHGKRTVIVRLTARVSSISDNGLAAGMPIAWPKSAQNQLTRNAAIELRHRSKQLIYVGLRPGTAATSLSEPFRARVPATRLQTPDQAAGHLIDVLARLNPEDSGHVFDRAGARIMP